MHKKLPALIKIVILLIIFCSSFCVYVFYIHPFIFSESKLKPLAQLPMPPERIHLTEPLVLPSVTMSVLGAQTLDPNELIDHVNIERAKAGSPPLRINPKLASAAKMRADVIMKYQNFSHQDPYEKVELGTVLPEIGYQFKYASENIGMGGLSGADFVNGFMHSTFHRENLLDPILKETGVAIVSGPYHQYYVNVAVQIFADPADIKNEFLGYNQQDINAVSNARKEIKQQIHDTEKLKQIHKQNQYYETWLTFLIKQEELLDLIYENLIKDKPVINEFIGAIIQYNTNWESIPNTAI